MENTGSTGKHRAWKQRSRGKHRRGKHGFWWETLGVENTGSGGKYGDSVERKTWGQSEKKNTGNHYFVEQNQNFVILNCIENHLT